MYEKNEEENFELLKFWDLLLKNYIDGTGDASQIDICNSILQKYIIFQEKLHSLYPFLEFLLRLENIKNSLSLSLPKFKEIHVATIWKGFF